MAKHKVYVTDHVFKSLDPERSILADADCDLIELSIRDASQIKNVAADAEVCSTLTCPTSPVRLWMPFQI